MALHTIAPGTGVSLRVAAGQTLCIIDPQGGQSGDLVAFRRGDRTEWLSNGRSFDYAGKIYLSTGDVLYSNRSAALFTIVHDDVGRHDFLYAACSLEMYRMQYGVTGAHPNCLDNLSGALGIATHQLPTPFNFFVNATVTPEGRLVVAPPLSRPGAALHLRAEIDLDVALSSCPAAGCNGGPAAPIDYEIVQLP